MDGDLNASIKFDMPLVSDVVLLLNSTLGSANYTKAWASIEAKVRSVRHSRSLLGYYICDDCNNAGSFPPREMAQLYQALKLLDPFHVVLGAPWAFSWSLFQVHVCARARTHAHTQASMHARTGLVMVAASVWR